MHIKHVTLMVNNMEESSACSGTCGDKGVGEIVTYVRDAVNSF